MSNPKENKSPKLGKLTASAAVGLFTIGLAAPAAAEVEAVKARLMSVRAQQSELAVDHSLLRSIGDEIGVAPQKHTNGHTNGHSNGGIFGHSNLHTNIHTNQAFKA